MFGRPPCRNAGGFLFPLHQVCGHFRRGAAVDLVHESPQGLALPFPLHQVCGHFRRGAAVDLVHESPQSLALLFPLHQVSGHFQHAAAVDLVHESPQGLVLPFFLHQVCGLFQGVTAVDWCTNPRKACYEVTVVKRRLQESFISRHVTFVFSCQHLERALI